MYCTLNLSRDLTLPKFILKELYGDALTLDGDDGGITLHHEESGQLLAVTSRVFRAACLEIPCNLEGVVYGDVHFLDAEGNNVTNPMPEVV